MSRLVKIIICLTIPSIVAIWWRKNSTPTADRLQRHNKTAVSFANDEKVAEISLHQLNATSPIIVTGKDTDTDAAALQKNDQLGQILAYGFFGVAGIFVVIGIVIFAF